jgi:hypothetical protein
LTSLYAFVFVSTGGRHWIVFRSLPFLPFLLFLPIFAICQFCLFLHQQVVDIGYFFDFGGSVNAKNRDGNTPLHCASTHGRTEAVEMLIKHGANIDSQNKVSVVTSMSIHTMTIH